MNSFTCLIVALVFASGAAATEKPDVPTTENECIAKGGQWTNVGLPGLPKRCDLKTIDGGKTCADSRDCQGECMALEAALVGAKSEGKCSSYIAEYGCRSRIENGIVGPRVCVD